MSTPSKIPSNWASRLLFDLLKRLPFFGSLIIIVKLSYFKTLQSLPFCNQMTPKNYVKGNIFELLWRVQWCTTRYIIPIRKSQGPKYMEPPKGPGSFMSFVSTIPNVCWPMTFSSKVASGARTFRAPCICGAKFVKRGSQNVSSGIGTSVYFEVTRNTLMGSWKAHNSSYGNPLVTRRFGDPLKRVEQVSYMVRERGLI